MVNEAIPIKGRQAMPMNDSLARIFEDIGTLKAMAAAINDKLDEGREDFRNIRAEQVTTKECIAALKADAEARTVAIGRIEEKLGKLERKVDPLITLRHRIGGAVIILTALGSFAYNLFDVLEHFMTWTIHPPK